MEDTENTESSLLQVSPSISCTTPGQLIQSFMYLLSEIDKNTGWMFASPYSSAVTSPDLSKRRKLTTLPKYEYIQLDGIMHWQKFVGRSQAGAVVEGMLWDTPNLIFKTIDKTKNSGAEDQFNKEVDVYKRLESLQGITIPRFVARGSLGGGVLDVIVLENVGRPIGKEEFTKRKSEIAKCLGDIHSLGVKHGDLRLPNILIDSKSCVRIIDFGMSEIKEIGEVIEEDFNVEE
jgi:hypothetical protein